MDLLCQRRGNLSATNKQTQVSWKIFNWVLYKMLLGAMKLKAVKSFSNGLWQEKWGLWLRLPPQLVFTCQLSICCEMWWAPDPALSTCQQSWHVAEPDQQPPLNVRESACSYPLPIGFSQYRTPSKAAALKEQNILLLSALQRAKKWPLPVRNLFPSSWHPHSKSCLSTSLITTHSFLFCLAMFTAYQFVLLKDFEFYGLSTP